jgi:hypothetical protein
MNEFSSMQSAANSQDASAATAVRKTAPTIDAETDDRRSLVLLLSLLFFLVLSAFVRDDWISEVVLALAVYAILVIAIVKISVERALPWPVLLLTASSLVVTIISIFCPMHTLRIANWLMLSIFFGYVSLAFFPFLEKAGPINRAKLDACLGLYLILAMFYHAIFNLMQASSIFRFCSRLLLHFATGG